MTTILSTSQVVDFYEINGNSITCFCYNQNDSQDGYDENEVLLDEFEEWLNGEGYLSGSEDVHIHPDHPLEGRTIKWHMNIDEFMDTTNHNWSISELLTQFLNK